MPRTSDRKRAIKALERELAQRVERARARELLNDPDPLEDEIDEYVWIQLMQKRSERYTTRKPKYRKREARWRKLLYDTEAVTDSEFLEHFRVERAAFHRLVALIKDDPVFQSAPHRTFRGPAELHLMVLLKFFGSFGNDNSASKHAQLLGIGKGSVTNYVRRTVAALLKLHDTTITWPDEDERKLMAARIQEKYGFPNCVGMIDGTLLPLDRKPEHKGEDYYTRKASYAINALIVCDDVARIRHIVVGWPGSVHDNRVWTNSEMCREPHKFFSLREYLLGDSAFQTSAVMVPAFKKPPKASMSLNKSFFNTKLAKARIKSEHSIGLLKARFQYFKGIRARLRDKKDMRRIIRLVLCGCILHNLLISEPVPESWERDIHENGLDDDDELNVAVPNDAPGGTRRDQLLAYMLELRG